jgi:hypothetical protein
MWDARAGENAGMQIKSGVPLEGLRFFCLFCCYSTLRVITVV